MCPGSRVTASSDIEGCGTGGYSGWVYRVGIPGWVGRGVLPGTTQLLEGEVQDSGAGPVALQGAEWVVLELGTDGRAGTAPGPPSGPGRSPPVPSLSRTLRYALPGQRGEIP